MNQQLLYPQVRTSCLGQAAGRDMFLVFTLSRDPGSVPVPPCTSLLHLPCAAHPDTFPVCASQGHPFYTYASLRHLPSACISL